MQGHPIICWNEPTQCTSLPPTKLNCIVYVYGPLQHSSSNERLVCKKADLGDHISNSLPRKYKTYSEVNFVNVEAGWTQY